MKVFIIKKNESMLTFNIVKDIKTLNGMINRVKQYPKEKGKETTYHIYETNENDIFKDNERYLTSVTV